MLSPVVTLPLAMRGIFLLTTKTNMVGLVRCRRCQQT